VSIEGNFGMKKNESDEIFKIGPTEIPKSGPSDQKKI
jgi:hypothetical protein